MAVPERTDVSTLEGAVDYLKQKFPDVVSDDMRQGFSGVIVDKNKLVEVATAVRDELGYDLLSSVTAVDWHGIADELETVYHAYRTSGGPALVFKAKTDREKSEMPSLIGVWPGADFQEREAWDLYGIRFLGHPNLRRILLWEGFDGHPMRKDWHEAYYEEEHKPFGSRWPGGHVHRAEELNSYGKNVRYPEGMDIDRVLRGDSHAPVDEPVYSSMGLGVDIQNIDGDDLETQQLVVNLGPQHPSTHGVFRMVVTLDGETIEKLEPVMGYLHRNHEQIGERNTYLHNIPFTDRLDYICSMNNNHGYVMAVEHLLSLGARYQPPTYRAEVIRVMVVELNRIVNHFWALGFLLNDIGAFFTPMLYALETRERILDFFEATAGARLLYNYMRFGGVFKDIPDRIHSIANLVNDQVRDFNTMDYLTELISESIPRAIDEFDYYLTGNEIVKERMVGVGILPPDVAIATSSTGPLLRGSGVAYDIRRADPYSIYPELDFDVAVRYNGDIYDRYLVRIDEMRESVRILKQILPRLERTKGEAIIAGNKLHTPRVPLGEAYRHTEGPKGELGYYVISAGDEKGTQNPWRYHVRAPSFINLTALGLMAKGHKVADVVAILGSIDIVLGETDR